ncbi:hypothetical protein J132_04345 [Termitomyces sp. J132]|nr:hypothetical protein H2248_008208 [Termitomyces sp. 'cryptogamus']KNZ72064.1 hypothetical protein J132_04345 [Termitomyces sp. J132]
MEPVPDTVPLDGTIHYPRTALLSMTRMILRDFEAYWIANNAGYIPVSDPAPPVASTSQNENEGESKYSVAPTPIPDDPISAIRTVRRGFDRKSFRDEQGAPSDEGFSDDIDAQYEKDIALEEQYLFGPGDPGRPWVVDEAVKLYKATRFEEDSEEYNAVIWREDALLDLLVFITREEHYGLFEIADPL